MFCKKCGGILVVDDTMDFEISDSGDKVIILVSGHCDCGAEYTWNEVYEFKETKNLVEVN